MHFSSSASAGLQNKMSSELYIHVIFKTRQVSCYHRVDGIVGKICWYLMGPSHAILNVIIGGGGGILQSRTYNPTTIPSQDDNPPPTPHHIPDLSNRESSDGKSLELYDEI